MPLGQVIASFGRHYTVEDQPSGKLLKCVPRGKKSEVACGDFIRYAETAPGQGVIEAIEPRRTLLYRADANRQKIIAANVSQLLIVVAAEPAFSEELVSRSLVAAHAAGIPARILLNKSDLPNTPLARNKLCPFERAGYAVTELSARENVGPLRELLEGETSVLVGQSGMGKSTLVNALLPDVGAATQGISIALDSGKHTTTHARLYHLNAKSALIDCPGLQLFGLHHLHLGQLELGFPEFRPYLGKCRFANCRHQQEPGCALQLAVNAGEISEARLAMFRTLARDCTL